MITDGSLDKLCQILFRHAVGLDLVAQTSDHRLYVQDANDMTKQGYIEFWMGERYTVTYNAGVSDLFRQRVGTFAHIILLKAEDYGVKLSHRQNTLVFQHEDWAFGIEARNDEFLVAWTRMGPPLELLTKQPSVGNRTLYTFLARSRKIDDELYTIIAHDEPTLAQIAQKFNDDLIDENGELAYPYYALELLGSVPIDEVADLTR
jgi:hypothetical protein